ncbi:UDP-glycosyltransferase-01 [Frankliniella occidentalis]|uniref:UDP-glycosyltransferase UGT5 n=1 Tax=Frankliniella occidentalis TaxID=133901 RepID=A0A6J1S929_FRAOC|nr:UDP-glycosyltransferase UGT5 [Frankliniella occidentalis]KAE8742922.1 UDP-glycosyltransferase-01 [Frankliniella occidentalis]
MASNKSRWCLALAVVVALVLCLGAPGVDSARILVVIAMPAPSHLIVFTALTRALADRGHQITLVCPSPKTDKLLPTHNHHIVSVQNSTVMDFKLKSVKKFMTGDKQDLISSMISFFNWGPQLVRATLLHPNFKAEVDTPNQKFDLVITEAFFIQEAMIALGHKFNAPVIALNPFGASPQINQFMGNSINPAWVPNLFLGFGGHLTFSERVINTVASTGMDLVYKFLQFPQQQALVSELFPSAPPLTDLLRNQLALVLVNNHHSLSFPVPMSPGVVEVGGMHITKKPKPLPKDLKDLMDGAKDGVVYFSMGSNLAMEYMPKQKTEAIFGALGSIKQRVLLKWDGPVPDTGVPSNIHIIKWAPQSDVLAHPNLRVFVTHGGLLSTQEAVYHGVPLVGIPVFADQDFNMRLATRKGFCEQVDFATLTQEGLSSALQKVLGSPSYKEAASLLSRLFRSKPTEPADLAVFWVEHVLEHGGAHLRPSNVDLSLYQLLLVDVILALLVPLVLAILILRAIFRWCCCRSKKGSSASGQPSKAAKAKKTN